MKTTLFHHSATVASPLPAARRGRGPRRPARGFTLVELLIALLAGIFVAMAAFLLARNATKFFQHEARVAVAQYAAMVGMNRLQADLQRASFLTLPNPANPDFKLAGSGGWPGTVRQPVGIVIEEAGSVTRHGADHALLGAYWNQEDPATGGTGPALAPDALLLAGSFVSTEEFAASAIVGLGGEAEVHLQVDDAAMARTLAAYARGGPSLTEIFAPKRYLRIVDPMGFVSYGLIKELKGGTAAPVVVLRTELPLPSRAEEKNAGVAGFGVGYTVNVVTHVLYDLRSVAADADYGPLHTLRGSGAGGFHQGVAEPPRTELVRVELDPLDAAGAFDEELAGTLEVVAEYAVDLKFGITHEAVPATVPPTLVRLPIGHDTVYDVAKAGAGGTPELVRAVEVRLSTRSAERDRDTAIPRPSTGGLYRFALGLGGDKDNPPVEGFARVRTLITEVMLANNR